jgi:DEAD/DEAH box helicase domain-containing protein
MDNTQRYFTQLIGDLEQRSLNGVLSHYSIVNESLRHHLIDTFSSPLGAGENLLGDPVFEATYGWKTGDTSLGELKNELFTKELIDVLDKAKGNYRLPKGLKPYTHQLKSWRLLKAPDNKSVVISSGTGSGKTECFMLPVLDSVIEKKIATPANSHGVKALMLYPLNALINSQRERLEAWTKGFNGKVTFGLYNGVTPEEGINREKNEIQNRKKMRSTPPDILVTNPTMLEYILVRAEDSPILEASQNSLEWIILDEAHSYIGSQAAEMALLLRRVLSAFNKRPQDVKFVATSATIGSPNAESSLKEFMAHLSGKDASFVEVITGIRSLPAFEKVDETINPLSTESISNGIHDTSRIPNEAKFIKNLFLRSNKNVLTLNNIAGKLFNTTNPTRQQQQTTLNWIDYVSELRTNDEQNSPFLPLRAHAFHKTISGIWACCNKNCNEKIGTKLSNSDWKFGSIFFEPRKKCKCGAPIFELNSCSDCKDVFMIAKSNYGSLTQYIDEEDLDEFELNFDLEDADLTDSESEIVANKTDEKVLIVSKSFDKAKKYYINHDDNSINHYSIQQNESEVYLYSTDDSHSKNICLKCLSTNSNSTVKHNNFRIGTPYLLSGIVPSVLEYAENDAKPLDKPFFGKKMLSFSDSRQGTARLSVRMQQEAERNYSRGLIYHNLAEMQKYKSNHPIYGIGKISASDLEKIKEILGGSLPEIDKSISFTELINRISSVGGEFELLRQKYENYARPLFGKDSQNMAIITVIRELGRRPVRQVNLETLGMVKLKFPKLKSVEAPVPWTNRGLSNEEWKEFLSYLLTHYFRGSGAIQIDGFDSLRNWLGLPFPLFGLLEPGQKDKSKKSKYWLNTETGKFRSRHISYLSRLLQVDVNDPYGADILDEVLIEAYISIRSKGLLNINNDGAHINFNDISFEIPDTMYFCPFTQRYVSGVIKNISPFTPISSVDPILCEEVHLPIYNGAYETTDPFERIKTARKWITSNSKVSSLKEEGKWTVAHDNVVLFRNYYRIEEHSAQQNSKKLKLYEDAFKDGRVNLLTCSTTMEMGIDIGGIQLVTMTNVPPHPANYLQRAGRAGRRNETKSVAVTICKDNPHDLHVFNNTAWPFTNQLPVPRVSLNSITIIQRHINSVLLSWFLKKIIQSKRIVTLSTGWFYLPENGVLMKFQDFLLEAKSFKGSHELIIQLRALLKNTPLELESISTILNETFNQVEQISNDWLEEHTSISKQLEVLKETESAKSKALQALQLQLVRLEKEYLLRELSSKGFLPGYGFPSDIVSFDSNTIETFKRDFELGRDDNRFRNRELPTRDAVTALREYAPGAEIVIDGLVHKSAGITLNWHLPSDVKSTSEPLSIKYSWRCANCGASGTTPSYQSSTTCDNCGSGILSKNIFQFISPSGFAVDFYDNPHNDVTRQSFIPVEKPIPSVKGEWQVFSNPYLGRYRVDEDATILYNSAGPNGNGYALCLSCGRAEPMPKDDELPNVFKDEHKPIRPRKYDEICKGSYNNSSIKERIRLAHQVRTGVLEIQLKLTDRTWLRDNVIARTLAVAIRQKIASKLGIEIVELDLSIDKKKESGEIRLSISIFDKNNAGYVAAVAPHLEKILKESIEYLTACSCDSSCTKCTLTYDQRFYVNELDRLKVLEVFDSKWISNMSIPDELKYFGESTKVESENIFITLQRQALHRDVGTVSVFFDKIKDSDDPELLTRYISLMKLFALKEKKVKIVLQKNGFEECDIKLRQLLFSLTYLGDISMNLIDEIPKTDGNSYPIIAEYSSSETVHVLALSNGLTFGDAEVEILRGTVLRGHLASGSDRPLKELTFDDVQMPFSNSQQSVCKLFDHFDGSISEFGDKFWSLLSSKNSNLEAKIKSDIGILSVEYTDSYIRSPFSAVLLYKILDKLSEVTDSEFEVNLKFSDYSDDRHTQPYKFFHSWQDSNIRDEVIAAFFAESSFCSSININSNGQNSVHYRELTLTFEDQETIKIWLDHGMGNWKIQSNYGSNSNRSNFTFGETSVQVEQLVNASWDIYGSPEGSLIGIYMQ